MPSIDPDYSDFPYSPPAILGWTNIGGSEQDPENGNAGDIYWNSPFSKYRVYSGTGWEDLGVNIGVLSGSSIFPSYFNSAIFAGSGTTFGTASLVARSDHNHAGTYITPSGVNQSITGGLTVDRIDISNASAVGLSIVSSSVSAFEVLDPNGTYQVFATSSAGNVSIYGSIQSTSANKAKITMNSDTGGILMSTSASTNKGLVIRGAASQSVNLQEWQDSASSVLSYINSSGSFIGSGASVSGSVIGASFGGNGAGLSNLTGASVTGTVASATNAATATNISGGSAGTLLYQSAAGVTEKLPAGSNTFGLIMLGGVPTWTNPASFTVGNATNVAITNDTTTSSSQYLAFTGASTGNTGIRTSAASLTYVPSTGVLSMTSQITRDRLTVGGSTLFSSGALTVISQSTSRPNLYLRAASGQTADLQRWALFDGTTATTITRVASAGNLVVSASSTSASDTPLIVQPNFGIASGGYMALFNDNSPSPVAILSDGRMLIGSLSDDNSTALQIVSTKSASGLALRLRAGLQTMTEVLDVKRSTGQSLFGINGNGQIYTGNSSLTASYISVAVGGATTAASSNGGVFARITTTSNHGLAVGDVVTVSGVTPSAYNGTYTVISVPSSTSFEYTSTASGAQTVAGTVSIPPAISVAPVGTGTIGMIMRGPASQTADFIRWQNSSASTLSAINSSGSFIGSGASVSGSVIAASFGGDGTAITGLGKLYNGATLVAEVNSGNEFILHRVNSASEGGQLTLNRASDDAMGWYIDLFGNTASPNMRWVDSTSTVRMTLEPNGNLTTTGNMIYNQATNSQSGSAYTLVASDAGKFVEMTSSAANTITVPAASTVAWSVGTRIDIIQYGAGTTTISPASGASINYYSPTSAATRTIKARYGAATLLYRATNEWLLIGNLT